MPTFVDETRGKASNPGRLKPKRLYYVMFDNTNLFTRLAAWICSYIPWFIAKHIPGVKDFTSSWVAWKEHFRYGNLCAAMVVDQREGKVAVFTNLSRIHDAPDVPVVMIMRSRLLPIIRNRIISEGSRLVAVSLYGNSQNLPYSWSEFNPVLVDCLGDDPAAALKAQNRIDESTWNKLERAVRQLPRSPEPGLYHVEV